MAAAVAVIAALVNWVYFSRRKLPAKYLTPGLIFLADLPGVRPVLYGLHRA